jgi:hypothetical protein
MVTGAPSAKGGMNGSHSRPGKSTDSNSTRSVNDTVTGSSPEHADNVTTAANNRAM